MISHIYFLYFEIWWFLSIAFLSLLIALHCYNMVIFCAIFMTINVDIALEIDFYFVSNFQHYTMVCSRNIILLIKYCLSQLSHRLEIFLSSESWVTVYVSMGLRRKTFGINGLMILIFLVLQNHLIYIKCLTIF